jgi:hypothetical protein
MYLAHVCVKSLEADEVSWSQQPSLAGASSKPTGGDYLAAQNQRTRIFQEQA